MLESTQAYTVEQEYKMKKVFLGKKNEVHWTVAGFSR